jgi:hypothetical protein
VAILAGLVMVASLSACGKQPVEEINATKAAVEAAKVDGTVYAAEDTKQVEDSLNAAMAEVKVQDEKFFKNYDKASQMLAQVKAQAATVKAKAEAEKERMKQKAIADLAAAQTAVAGAKELLDKAPKGKGSAADVMAMKADVAGMEAALPEIQPMIDGGDYMGASSKAVAISEKAAGVSTAVQEALDKKAAAKGGKKK